MRDYEVDIENCGREIEQQSKELNEKNSILNHVESSIENLSADTVVANILKENKAVTEKDIEAIQEKKAQTNEKIENLIDSILEEKKDRESDYAQLKGLEAIGEDVTSSLEVVVEEDNQLTDYLLRLQKLQEVDGEKFDDYLEDASKQLSIENAKAELNEYMALKNYGKEDYLHGDNYSQDPKWRELHQKAYPDFKIPAFNLDQAIDRLPRLDSNVSQADILSQTNPNYDKGEKFQVNCQRCVPAYEMRRRGYNVTAKPLPCNDDIYQYEYLSMWDNPQEIKCSGSGLKDIKQYMKSWGDGSRAEVSIDFKGLDYSHLIVAEQRAGKTIFVDPQNNEILDDSFFKTVESNKTSICRLDNLKPNRAIFDCVGRVKSL